MYLEFSPRAEFVDRLGITRRVALCSLIGQQEFFERITEIASLLGGADAGESWQELYTKSDRFQFLSKRCLELNGIDPEWLTLNDLEPLLIGQEDDPGWLVTLNTPKPAEGKEKGQKDSASLAEIVAAIGSMTGSIEEGLRLVATLPAPVLLEILEARVDQTRSPEEKQKADFKKRKPDLLKALKEVQERHKAEYLAGMDDGSQHDSGDPAQPQ